MTIEYAWIIEARHQPQEIWEGREPEFLAMAPANGSWWTTDSVAAFRFPTEQQAKTFIRNGHLSATAVLYEYTYHPPSTPYRRTSKPFAPRKDDQDPLPASKIIDESR